MTRYKQYTYQFYAALGSASGSCVVKIVIDGILSGSLELDSASGGSDYTLFQTTRLLTGTTGSTSFVVQISCKGPTGSLGHVFFDDFSVSTDDEQEPCPGISPP